MTYPPCKTCPHFTSFREDYCDDLEPDWCGFCSHPKTESDAAGIGDRCKYHPDHKPPLLLPPPSKNFRPYNIGLTGQAWYDRNQYTVPGLMYTNGTFDNTENYFWMTRVGMMSAERYDQRRKLLQEAYNNLSVKPSVSCSLYEDYNPRRV